MDERQNLSKNSRANSSGQNPIIKPPFNNNEPDNDSKFISKDNLFAFNLKFSSLFMKKKDNSDEEDDNEFIDHFEKLKNEKLMQETQGSYHLSTKSTDHQEYKDYTDLKNYIEKGFNDEFDDDEKDPYIKDIVNKTLSKQASPTKKGEKGEKLDNLSTGEDYPSNDLNFELTKLIDSPSKLESTSPLKGKKIIIADQKKQEERNKAFPSKHQNSGPIVSNLSMNQNNNMGMQMNNQKSPINYTRFNNFGFMGIPNRMMMPFVQNGMPGAIPMQPGMNQGHMAFHQMGSGMSPNLYHTNSAPYINIPPIGQNLMIPKPNQSDVIKHFSVDSPRTTNSNDCNLQNSNSKYKSSLASIYSRYPDMSEEELIQNGKELSKDQGGCRFLQKLLDNSPNLSTSLYNHLESDLIELINDSFGNYLIQKLIEKLPPPCIDKFLGIVNPHMMNIGINPHGTRVLQKLIDTITTNEQKDRFISYFKPCVITFCNDINGNHIIQKFITTISAPKNQFIFEIIQQNIKLVGLNKHGCCALQKCIEFGTDKQRNDMINSSIKHARAFLTDQYGNYVLQNIISYKNFNANKIITESFLKDILKLSKEKFSSNVIEKCMDYCDKETKEKILKKLANPEYIPDLLMDMYGNYVIQKALQISNEPHYSIFIENIGPVLSELRNLAFGSKLYTKFINNYPEFADYLDDNDLYYEDYYDYENLGPSRSHSNSYSYNNSQTTSNSINNQRSWSFNTNGTNITPSINLNTNCNSNTKK